jgi:hypothetical protein
LHITAAAKIDVKLGLVSEQSAGFKGRATAMAKASVAPSQRFVRLHFLAYHPM